MPELAERRPPPTGAADLRRWWQVIGQRGAGLTFDDRHWIVLPEPTITDETRLARLTPLVCLETEPACGADVRAFAAEADLRLQVLAEAAARTETKSLNERVAACARPSGKSPLTLPQWQDCVEAALPKVVRLPHNRLRMPEQGTLLLSRAGNWQGCRHQAAYALNSGAELSRVSCSYGELERERWTFSKLHPSAVRQAALLAVLLPALRESPATPASFPLPPSLEPEPGYRKRVVPSRFRVSDTLTLHYEVRGVLDEPVRDHVYVYVDRTPARRLLVQLLDALQNQAPERCAAPADFADLSDLLEALGAAEEIERVLSEVSCPAMP
jgi:hypothetical protein